MPERNHRHAGGRFDAGDEADNEPDQIVQQDEEPDAGDEGLEALVAVADDLFARSPTPSWIISAICWAGLGFSTDKREADNEEEEDEDAGDQHLQREGAVDCGCLLGGVR